jgi:cyd operon protein YbgT
MWYFTWVLGIFLAITLGIINVMWYEAEYDNDGQGESSSD